MLTAFIHVVYTGFDVRGELKRKARKKSVLVNIVLAEVYKYLICDIGLQVKHCELEREVKHGLIPESPEVFFVFNVAVFKPEPVTNIKTEEFTF